MLPSRFEEPAGFKWGSFKDADGANIRYGSLQPQGEPKGTIVLTAGFREPIEKYFEVMRDMTERGFAVWMMDWRGQGGSDHFLPAHLQRVHCLGYDKHIAALDQFAQNIVAKSGGPLILMAHSMGGHIGLRYLKEHEGVFDSAVFTSPMCDIQTPGFPRRIVQLLLNRAEKKGYLENYIPGGHDWDGKDEDSDRLSHDQARQGVMAQIFRQKPELIVGDATYGWVKRTLESIKALNDPSYLKAIKTPVLIGIAGEDKTVDSRVTRNAASLMPNCTSVEIPAAKHEIWMESDNIRAPWLERVGAFLQERLGQQAPAPKKSNVKPSRPPGL